MPLALPFIAIAGLAASLVLLAMLDRTDAWLRSLLVWIFKDRSSFWKKALLWPLKKIVPALARVEHAVSSAIGHAIAWTLKPVTRHFHSLAVVVRDSAIATGYLAQQTHDALYYLRHTAVPKLIETAVAPVRLAAAQARAIAQAVTTRFNRVEDRFTDSLAALGIGVWSTLDNALVGFAHYADRLHDQVWQVVTPRVDQLFYTLVPQLTRGLQDIAGDLYNTGVESIDQMRARLRALEDLVGKTIGGFADAVLAVVTSVAGVAAITAVLTQIAPELFCKNTRSAARKLCGFDESMLEALLAGTLALVVALNVEEIAREAQEGFRLLDGLVREMAEV